MDSAGDSKGDGKALVCRSAPRSLIFRCLVALPTVACFMLSVSSIAICFLVSFKTSQLEHRVHALEMEKKSVFHPPEASFLGEDGTVLPVFRDTIEKLLQERLNEAIPKLRTARDVGPECSCPPGVSRIPQGFAVVLTSTSP
ncbi:hypothetical protein MATL_G00173280 [Megalops atlanticus]|uniref:Collagen alpha-1(XXIII) chain n=1 Tax=Megalops atlanticus TaxID=7932 RepID=A0A9D3PP93_MEGAT|nr:hypothetical protein MATL_G00173280 [Megalops atlanticus]